MARPRFIGLILAVLCLLLVLIPAGCGSDRRDEPFTQTLDVSDPKIALGQQVFMSRCNQCHPGGSAGFGPSLNNRDLFAWYIKFKVRNGGGGMPGFSTDRIGEPQLDAATEYLLALRSLPPR